MLYFYRCMLTRVCWYCSMAERKGVAHKFLFNLKCALLPQTNFIEGKLTGTQSEVTICFALRGSQFSASQLPAGSKMSAAQIAVVQGFEGIFAGALPSPVVSFVCEKVLKEHFKLQGPESPPSQRFMKTSAVALNSFLKCDAAGFCGVDERAALKSKELARIALKTSYTQLFLLFMSTSRSGQLTTESDFLANYPSFQMEDPTEVSLLWRFRNYLVVSFRFLPAKKKKKQHIFIAGVLSAGKMVQYKTGTGQTPAVCRSPHLRTGRRIIACEAQSPQIQ